MTFDFLKWLNESELSIGRKKEVRDAWAKHHLENVMSFRKDHPINWAEWCFAKNNWGNNALNSINQVECVWSRERIEQELKKKMEEKI